MYMLFGVDDSAYFGCELPCRAASIDEAFRALTPDHLHGVSGLVRQGEWFMVPVKEKDVPDPKDCVLLFNARADAWEDEVVFLPLDHPDSNCHVIGTTDGRVGRDGKVYALSACLDHQEHGTTDAGSKWVTFEKNTAVRSYSQEGVD